MLHFRGLPRSVPFGKAATSRWALPLVLLVLRPNGHGSYDQQHGVLVGRMGMLSVQVDVGFPEGGQYVHLTEVNPVPFLSGPTGRDDSRVES